MHILFCFSTDILQGAKFSCIAKVHVAMAPDFFIFWARGPSKIENIIKQLI